MTLKLILTEQHNDYNNIMVIRTFTEPNPPEREVLNAVSSLYTGIKEFECWRYS